MPKQSSSHPSFRGFPYLVTRVVPALYHVILLPARLSASELRVLARQQVLVNRLDTCLVLAGNRVVYFDPSGDSRDTDTPPADGSVITGQLSAPVDFPDLEELRTRQEQLDQFAAASRAHGGYVMGDLTKGGRPATDEELCRFAGTEAHGRPVGLDRCAQCNGYRGMCLDPGENFRGQVMTVYCACENHNRCARCGEHLYEHRLNANYYNPTDRQIWHVSGFCGLSHRCGSETEAGGDDHREHDHAERALGLPIHCGLLIRRPWGFGVRRVISGVVALARRVVEAGAGNADGFPNARAADRHVRAANAKRQTWAGRRHVQRETGTQVQTSIKAQPHVSG
jgi:hypothetical protein